MGTVAVTAAKPKKAAKGATVAKDVTLTLSSSYATGGDTLVPGAVGLHSVVEALQLASGSPADVGVQVVLAGTATQPKLKVVRRSDAGSAAEMAAGTNLSAVTVKMRLIGT